MDTLILKECRFDCAIGVTEEERAAKQPVIIDVELAVQTAQAGKTDALADTVDYLAVHERLRSHIEEGSRNLVETLAEQLAGIILSEFPVASVTLTVRKPKPMEKRNGAWAGVTITRTRAQ